jgi:hypothetical protein
MIDSIHFTQSSNLSTKDNNINFRDLILAVIVRGIRDACGLTPATGGDNSLDISKDRCRREGKKFINSIDFAYYCDLIDIDYKIIRYYINNHMDELEKNPLLKARRIRKSK